MKRFITGFLDRTVGALLRLLSPGCFYQLMYWLVHWYVRRRDPAEALRVLFRLDSMLYSQETRYAREYGGGIHPKHRQTRYADFFVRRIRPEDRVLDVGCGHGEVARQIAENSGATVTGIDLLPDKIAQAQARNAHPHVRYLVGDVLAGSPDESFDVIVLSNVLEHIDERVGLLCRLTELYQPRRLLICVPRYDRDWRIPLRDELGVDYRLSWDHRIEYRPETFVAEIEEAGLRIVEQTLAWGEIWAEVAPVAVPVAKVA